MHESVLSRTWQMKHPPRGVFFAETMQRMLEPHKDIARKRVAILYRPETPETSANTADADVRKAIFKATQGKRAKAAAEAELEAARQTARQEAQGSPLVRVGVLVTVSTFDEDALRRGSRAVRSGIAAQARIGLRVPVGSQDMAFLTGMPLGLAPQQISRAATRRRTRGRSDPARSRAGEAAQGPALRRRGTGPVGVGHPLRGPHRDR